MTSTFLLQKSGILLYTLLDSVAGQFYQQ